MLLTDLISLYDPRHPPSSLPSGLRITSISRRLRPWIYASPTLLLILPIIQSSLALQLASEVLLRQYPTMLLPHVHLLLISRHTHPLEESNSVSALLASVSFRGIERLAVLAAEPVAVYFQLVQR